MRFRSWADKVNFVRYMNMHLAWAPGGINDWADLLSRVADKLQEAAQERERLKMMMPMMKHSHHQSDDEKGESRRQERFSFTAEEWGEVHRAYLADETRMHHVKMCDLYRVICMGGEGVDPGIVAKVRTWKQKSFVDVTPPGSEHPVLYTTRRQLRRHGQSDGDEKVLVMVVPDGAMVRITNGEIPADSRSEEKWKKIDLKTDILIWAHEQKSHPKKADTIESVRQLAWFTDLVGCVRRHLDACGFCLGRQHGEHTVRMGIESMQRAVVMQMDHRKLTVAEMEAIGGAYVAVLTMTDVATRKVIYEPVTSESAMETAMTIVMDWMPKMAVP